MLVARREWNHSRVSPFNEYLKRLIQTSSCVILSQSITPWKSSKCSVGSSQLVAWNSGRKYSHWSLSGSALGKPTIWEKSQKANLWARIFSISNQWSHQSILESWSRPVKDAQLQMCLVLVHHQRPDLNMSSPQEAPQAEKAAAETFSRKLLRVSFQVC